jgi:hypothetical protein
VAPQGKELMQPNFSVQIEDFFIGIKQGKKRDITKFEG